MKTTTIIAALLLAADAGFANPVPLSFDVAEQFSVAANPNGLWSYGYEGTLGGNVTLFDVPVQNIMWGSPPVTYNGWNKWGVVPAAAGGDQGLGAYKNNTGATISLPNILEIPDQAFYLHPGANGDYAIARWTVPSAGNYAILGYFMGLDQTSTDVHILVNNVSLYDNIIDGSDPFARGYRVEDDFSLAIHFNAGDSLDFAVGYGAGYDNPNIPDSTYDSTRLSVQGFNLPDGGSSAFLLLLALPSLLWRVHRNA
jgi:hypothetical protein